MKAHEHFAASHTFHKAASKEHAALAEECDGQGYEKMAERHKNLAKLHSDHAEHDSRMYADAASKAASDELEKARSQVMPTHVSAVTPTPPGVRMVPRAGQKLVEKVAVDPEFEDLVKIDSRDGDE
jgi:hypothetical protein